MLLRLPWRRSLRGAKATMDSSTSSYGYNDCVHTSSLQDFGTTHTGRTHTRSARLLRHARACCTHLCVVAVTWFVCTMFHKREDILWYVEGAANRHRSTAFFHVTTQAKERIRTKLQAMNPSPNPPTPLHNTTTRTRVTTTTKTKGAAKATILPPSIPTPMTVGCISAPRSGSTVAYNLVRLMMERLDPNTVSGYRTDVVATKGFFGAPTHETINHLLERVHGKVSMVYKSHALMYGDDDIYAGPRHTDFYVITYRDPYETTCSGAVMFPQGRLLEDPLRARKACRSNAKEEDKVKKMASQSRALHIHYEALRTPEGIIDVIDRLKSMWHVQGHLDSHAIAADLMRLKAPEDGVFLVHHPKTLLHSGHVTHADTTHLCDGLSEVLSTEPTCRKWHETYADMFKDGLVVEQEGGREGVRVERLAWYTRLWLWLTSMD